MKDLTIISKLISKKIFNMKNIKNSFGIVLVFLGTWLILRFIDIVNSPYRMSHAMEILTESVISGPAVILGVIFLFIGKKLTSFSIHWLYRILFVVTFVLVCKNVWLYSYVPFEVMRNDGNHVYPELGSDIFAFIIVGILLLNSILFGKKLS
jgi:protein-S-isoprenylcysteine O-methyltransferase Ste14